MFQLEMGKLLMQKKLKLTFTGRDSVMSPIVTSVCTVASGLKHRSDERCLKDCF